jgi:16S rRNA (guanine1516-N2)-methyltransferase
MELLRARGFSLEFENTTEPSVRGITVASLEDSLHRRLTLRDLEEPKRLPLAVDFLTPQIFHRLRCGLGQSQPLPRALGLRLRETQLAVFDATAGLGIDAFFMAAHGCRVRSVERSEIVYALLADGLFRLKMAARAPQADPHLLRISENLTFEHAQAKDLLESLPAADWPDAVYLDPMFPEETRSESALPKKGMQVFRRLLGDDTDASEVFEIALLRARDRVVVKRPLKAANLGGRATHVFEGKTARYDMYKVTKLAL